MPSTSEKKDQPKGATLDAIKQRDYWKIKYFTLLEKYIALMEEKIVLIEGKMMKKIN